ncbi:MAG: STAS domain-containing protein [Clostridiales Family XIII bacterium]|jgi:anti-anti-sigma factor|nr:STAS domain-containing protein [Clostridiales Family XIII bacterium]
MSLSISGDFNEAEDLWLLKLSGEIDISNAHHLKKQLETAYEQTRANIAIDLADLNYIDSTGLGVIIGAYGVMRGAGHRIILRRPKENVKKLLRITSLDKVLCKE